MVRYQTHSEGRKPRIRLTSADIVVDFEAADVTTRFDGIAPGRMYSRPLLILRLPADASARLVPDQPTPVVREAEM